MKLAERAGVASLAVVLGATAALALVTTPDRLEKREPATVISIRVEATPPAVACPTFVREQLRLGESATVRCVHGNFGEPAYFALGEYRTTEPWQRLMVISDDGSRVLVPRTDRPLLRAELSLAAEDVEGDGFDEVVSGLEIITIHDGNFLFGVR